MLPVFQVNRSSWDLFCRITWGVGLEPLRAACATIWNLDGANNICCTWYLRIRVSLPPERAPHFLV
jgi:hypothetical protein